MAVAERILHLRPDTDTRPDRALVYEAQRGHEEAATTLIRRYYPRIYSFVSHLTYGRSNTEDLTQEVFARALKALGRFNGEYQFEHWLLRIAKNLVIDEARRNVRQPEPTDPVELPELDGIPAPDYVWESVSRDLVATVVHRALQALPARQRTVLVMREMEGMSYADIAQVIGTNPRGVEATLRRARVRFRMEVSRAESAEEARAACRRVLSLVSDNPRASRSEETAAHLAACADCRRRTRDRGVLLGRGLGVAPRRAFGLVPLFGLQRLAGMLRRPAMAPSVRRMGVRARDTVALASFGSSAVMAAPVARMAEVAGGVLVATVVTLSPGFATAGVTPPATAVVSVAAAAVPLQLQSVPSEAVLYKASPAAAVTANLTSPNVVAGGPSVPTPSVVGPAASTPAATPQDLLTGLGLGPGQNPVATTLATVGSVSNILADQLNQVARLADHAVSQVVGGLPPQAQGLTGPVNELTGGVTTGLGTVLNGLGSDLQQGSTPSSSSSGH